jgi:hypothetical protein
MDSTGLSYIAIEGKTYSLFGESQTTSFYFDLIKSQCEKLQEIAPIREILQTIRKNSSKKRFLKKLISKPDNSLISDIIKQINNDLLQYTKRTNSHLKEISPFKFWDRRLATTEEQYHLYMLEIELTNQLNKEKFLNADRKISLQPYCLQDFSVACKSASNGFDYQCRHCSRNCFQGSASLVLKKHGVEPYIWMGASIKSAAKEAFLNNQTFGILGIACIPELVWGMRKCVKYGIPVIGLPLNANRCIRWFGEFHQNSVDLEELEKLFK